jgi:hypothetical protein
MTKTELANTTVLSRHVFYVGDDGDIHEMRGTDGQNWTHTNITQGIPAAVKPKTGANPSAYAFLGTNTLHVVYRGTDDRIHELWGPPGSWNYNPIGAPFTKAKGDPAGYVTEKFGVQHVVYRGENDQVVELWWYGIWRENVLTNTRPGIPLTRSDVSGYSGETTNTQHVAYFDADGNPGELAWNIDGWHSGSYMLENPFPDPLGALAAPFFYASRDKSHTFFVEPSVAETVVHEWTDWIVTTREFVDPPIFAGPLVALNPHVMELAPSKSSLIQFGPPVAKEIYQTPAVILSSKGDVRSGISTGPVQALAAIVTPVTVVSPKQGVLSTLGNITKLNTRGGF